MSEQGKSTRRPWIILGGVFAVVLLCIACLLFVITQFREELTANAWVQLVNDGELDDETEMICADSQAEQFSQVFLTRYGEEVELDIKSVEQEDDRIHMTGELQVDDRTQTYEAFFSVQNGGTGFLNMLGCVEKIEQVEPDIIPITFLGG